jgi:plastocyanin
VRKLIATLVAVAIPAALGVATAATASAGGPTAQAAATRTVTIGDNYFSPRTLTVRKGTRVRWIWGPGGRGTVVDHNVTAVKGNRFASPDATKRAPFVKTITRTTTIYCTLHPTTMKMTIKVR